MTTFYSEEDGCHVYPIRCDKHNFKEYEYCETCYMKSRLQSVVEESRKEFDRNNSQMFLSISVLNDCFNALEKRVKKLEELSVK
jgi:hypothetical protein